MTRGGKREGAGRPAGVPNRLTAALKDTILNAFEKAGGEAYLVRVAEEDPKTFCTLLGKVLPMQVTGAGDGPVVLEIVRFADKGG